VDHFIAVIIMFLAFGSSNTNWWSV